MGVGASVSLSAALAAATQDEVCNLVVGLSTDAASKLKDALVEVAKAEAAEQGQDEVKLSPLQSKLTSAACAKDSAIIPIITDDELFNWAKFHEEHILKNSVKIISLRDSAQREVECSVQFGETVFLTNFTGSIPACMLPAFLGDTFKQGSLTMVRLGDYTIEFSPGFRRYLVADDSLSECHPDIVTKVERIELPRTVLQISAEMEADSTLTVSCTTLGGIQVAALKLPGLNVTIGELIEDAARASDLDPLCLELSFPSGISSRAHSSDTKLCAVL